MRTNVEIPLNVINRETRKIIKKLEARCVRLEAKNSNLKVQLASYENQIKRANCIVEAVKQAGEFRDWDDE